MAKERTNYKTMTWMEAKQILDKSLGMPRATWQKLWKIANNKKRDNKWAESMGAKKRYISSGVKDIKRIIAELRNYKPYTLEEAQALIQSLIRRAGFGKCMSVKPVKKAFVAEVLFKQSDLAKIKKKEMNTAGTVVHLEDVKFEKILSNLRSLISQFIDDVHNTIPLETRRKLLNDKILRLIINNLKHKSMKIQDGTITKATAQTSKAVPYELAKRKKVEHEVFEAWEKYSEPPNSKIFLKLWEGGHLVLPIPNEDYKRIFG